MCQVAQRINIYMCVVWIVGVILCNADMTASCGVCRICHGARRPCVAYTPHHTHASIARRSCRIGHACSAYIYRYITGRSSCITGHACSARLCPIGPRIYRPRRRRNGHAYITGRACIDVLRPIGPTHRRACALDENAGMAKTKGAGRCRRPLTRKFTFHAQKKTCIAFSPTTCIIVGTHGQ